MAILTVTNSNASGAGSLAQAVVQANIGTQADTIVFAKALAGQTINLSGDLVLTNSVTINGDTNKDGEADITINMASGRVVNGAVSVTTLTALTVTGGNKVTGAAYSDTASAIINDGTLTLSYCSFLGNTTQSLITSGDRANAATIVNNGMLTITQSLFENNSNTAAHGHNATFPEDGKTGGDAGTVINRGVLVLDATGFTSNSTTGGQGGAGRSSYGYVGGYYVAGNGGRGGSSAGAVLNSGNVSGNYGAGANSEVGGAGGIPGPYGATGATGDAAEGLLNVGIGMGTLVLTQMGTLNADSVSLGVYANFAGLGGADTISAGAGSTIDSGAGADRVTVTSIIPDDPDGLLVGCTVRLGLGNDKLTSVFTANGSYDGGGGRDTIDFSQDALIDGQVFDLRNSSFTVFNTTITGFENAIGSAGSDIIFGSKVANILIGGFGNDVIEGGRGADRLNGGVDFDTLSYEHSLAGVNVNIALNTASGGDAAGDTILNFENVIGSGLADVVRGSGVSNVLFGGNGADTLIGAAGDDELHGGAGKDILAGGAGADVFVLSSTASSADTIADFKAVDDTLEISAADFGGGLVAGGVAAGRFVSNTTGQAGDANDRFIYNTANGQLFFDSNGDTAGGSRLIATFGSVTHPTLTNLDFIIV